MTPDLTGSIRLGPDAHYVDAVDYTVDPRAATDFAAAARRCISGIPDGVLLPDTAGVRPKLQGPDDGFRDFVITPEAGRGLPRLVDLIGIESPGLTSSSAIAGYVDSLLRDSGLI
jgi:L-2-hydroxyglutarate oxidase LhgO